MVLAQAASATPLVNAATAVVGTSTRFARADHVHPLQSPAPDVIIEEQYTSGTDGGTPTASAWTARTLNTVVRNVGSLASLASNQITLPAGTYYFECQSQMQDCGFSKCKIYNATDSADAIIGSSESSTSGSYSGSVSSTAAGVVTIAGSKAFEMRYYVTAGNAKGMGQHTGASVVESYARVKIWRMA